MFWNSKLLNEIVVNYKIVNLYELYNFNIKFVFIHFHLKKLWIVCVVPIL
jgi:hypothetical protein